MASEDFATYYTPPFSEIEGELSRVHEACRRGDYPRDVDRLSIARERFANDLFGRLRGADLDSLRSWWSPDYDGGIQFFFRTSSDVEFVQLMLML